MAPSKPEVSRSPGVPVSARARLAIDQQSVTLIGAINETMSFHFAGVAGAEPVTLEAIEMSPFQSSAGHVIRPEPFGLFRLHAVAVPDYPGWHLRSRPPGHRLRKLLDVLVPLDAPQGGLPVRLGPGEAAHFWVDVPVPKRTVAGTYAADLRVKSRGRIIATLPIRLTVRPIVLPDDSDIPFIVDLDHRKLPNRVGERKEERDVPLIATLRMLQAHRLNPTLSSLSPAVRIGTDGEAIVDWTRYDEIVSPCLDGGLPGNGVSVRYWPWPIGPAREAFLRSSESPSPSTLKLIRGYLRACEEHFASKGWLDHSYALWSATGDRRATVDSTLRFSAMLRRAAGRLPFASPLCPQDLAPYGWVDYEATDFKDAIDIWAPPAQFFDPDVMNIERASVASATGGHRTWITVDRPPFSGSITVYASPADIRVLTWQAMQLGAEAVLLGAVNHWPSRIANPDACIQFDPGVLLYPGAPFGLSVPVASVRLKMLRQSLQDAAYLRLLGDRGLEHIGRVLGHSLAPYSGMQACRTHFADGRRPGWPVDGSLFDAAREIMASQLIQGDQANRPPGDTLPFLATARWRAFMAATRIVRVRADGARLDLLETSPSVVMRLNGSVSVWNGRRTALNVRAKLKPPDGCLCTAESSRDVTIAPNSFGRTTLTARITMPPMTGRGVLTLPIILEEPDGTSHEVSARVALVAALPFQGRLTIDGDLSDWPPGTTNVATDFRLITGEVFDTDGEDAGRPRRATMAFFLRDEKYLYVAINCTYDRRSIESNESNAHRKSVTYDDLIPIGEEMVELLLDPLNGGTRTPSDLYHIVVKAAGTDLAEIGIRTDLPVARRRGWLVDLEVATRSYPDRWTVELRIPLDAFGVPNISRTIWGLNITRVDQANQEFSTWSGAVGNAYDPLSLGNLYLP